MNLGSGLGAWAGSTAVLKPPQSQRWRAPARSPCGAKRLDCGGFSAAVPRSGFRGRNRGSWRAVGSLHEPPADSRRPQMGLSICGRLESAGNLRPFMVPRRGLRAVVATHKPGVGQEDLGQENRDANLPAHNVPALCLGFMVPMRGLRSVVAPMNRSAEHGSA